MAGKTVVRKRGEGEAIWMLGGLYEVKASSDETGGGMTVMEFTVPVGMGPPPHTHEGAELVYVLEGTARYRIGEETIDAGPGTVIHFPAGTLETFEPTSTLRVLIVYTPGGIDRFFAEAGEPAQAREAPPAPSTPPDVNRIASIGERYGLHIKAPTSV
jgi:quercetin dioxygenase-like cupin family protein